MLYTWRLSSPPDAPLAARQSSMQTKFRKKVPQFSKLCNQLRCDSWLQGYGNCGVVPIHLEHKECNRGHKSWTKALKLKMQSCMYVHAETRRINSIPGFTIGQQVVIGLQWYTSDLGPKAILLLRSSTAGRGWVVPLILEVVSTPCRTHFQGLLFVFS